jgi:hypothetical protein
MTIMSVYKNDNDIIRNVLWIINCIVNIKNPRIIVEAGLLEALVEVFDNNKRNNDNYVNCNLLPINNTNLENVYLPNHLKDLRKIVISLKEWDSELYQELRSLGMPRSKSLLTRNNFF